MLHITLHVHSVLNSLLVTYSWSILASGLMAETAELEVALIARRNDSSPLQLST